MINLMIKFFIIYLLPSSLGSFLTTPTSPVLQPNKTTYLSLSESRSNASILPKWGSSAQEPSSYLHIHTRKHTHTHMNVHICITTHTYIHINTFFQPSFSPNALWVFSMVPYSGETFLTGPNSNLTNLSSLIYIPSVPDHFQTL